MKKLFDWVRSRRDAPRAPAPASVVSSELTTSDIETYYLRVIVDVLRRLLVPADSVEIGVKRTASGHDGLPAFSGYVRILRWDPIMPVLLQNLPVIDGRVRRIVAASVILEHTHFQGLWVQAASTIEAAPESLVGMPTELIRQSVS